MNDINWFSVPDLTDQQKQHALRDMELIARGEELDIPWRRVRTLLDHGFAEINHPVITQGSCRSLGLTDNGLQFMDNAVSASTSESKA